MKGVTQYSGLSKYYFQYLLHQLVKVGDLHRPGVAILDYGCGIGKLKQLLVGANVIGYDVIPSLSDVSDWRSVYFDVLVANEVFYSFSESDLDNLLSALSKINPNLELVVGISRQGMLNKIGKYLLGRSDAHSATKICPKKELEILKRHCRINRKKNVMNLAYVYSLTFKGSVLNPDRLK